MFGRASAARFSRLLGRRIPKAAATVACAAAMPLLCWLLRWRADYAKVSHFRSRVQLAADAASVATAEAVARQPDIANDSDALWPIRSPMPSSSARPRGGPGRRRSP